jgi:hypothetical protein
MSEASDWLRRHDWIQVEPSRIELSVELIRTTAHCSLHCFCTANVHQIPVLSTDTYLLRNYLKSMA